jgi:hypothetical protein
MELIPITETEVINTITSLKTKKSSGYDGISNMILKNCVRHKQAFYIHMQFFPILWNFSR